PEVGVALAGSGGDQVVELDVACLSDAVDASHALLEPDEGPGDVPVHQDVRGLEIDSFVSRVGTDEDLEMPRCEFGTYLVSDGMRVATRVPLSTELVALKPGDEPVGGVGEFGEDHGLLTVPGDDPIGGEAVVDKAGPLRDRLCVVADVRVEA